jgi:hypothetical protein
LTFGRDKTFYGADNVFWVPAAAHFDIEAEDPSLRDVLYREFSRLELEPGKLGELMQLLAKVKFSPDRHGSRDVFGEVYEYFLGQFALKEGARADEFYTPESVVSLLVEILAPFKGTIYDPACGSGGMSVQSARFKDAHQGPLKKKGDLAIYGKEQMAATRRVALMNLAVHGQHGDLGAGFGDTFTNDQHKTLRADYVLANPPFNISDWGGDKLTDDPRWVYGIPPMGNANFAWLQHMLARLSTRGRAGIVLANGSMSSQQSGEGDIRRNMVNADVVECMVALPGPTRRSPPAYGSCPRTKAQRRTAARIARARSFSLMRASRPAAGSVARRWNSPTPSYSALRRPITAGVVPCLPIVRTTRMRRPSTTAQHWPRWRSTVSCSRRAATWERWWRTMTTEPSARRCSGSLRSWQGR